MGKYVHAREHMIDFVVTLRRLLLEVLRDAPAVTQPDVDRDELADFAPRGTKTPRVVVPRLGTVTVGFRIPVSAPERLQAGMSTAGSERHLRSRSTIEVHTSDTPARTPALDKLSPDGFWTVAKRSRDG